MSQEFKYQSIVLGKRDVGEVDRMYILYTAEKGKVKVMGKGVRRPQAKLAGNLETLNFSEVFVSQGRGRGNITGVIAQESFFEIRNFPEAMEKVFYVFGLFERIVESEEKDERMFKLLLEYLLILNDISKEKDDSLVEILTAGFLFKFLDYLGYRLEVANCVSCGKSLKLEKNFLGIPQGGILCENCAKNEPKKIPLSNNAIKVMRLFLKNDLRGLLKIKMEKSDVDSLKRATRGFLSWIG